MRVTVLGGSAASVGTGQGCAGFLIEHGDTRLVLDLGPGTLQELRKHADFRALDAVVISHLHVDHVLDVIALRFALAYNPVRPGRPLPLWLPPGGLDFLGRLATVLDVEGDAGQYFSKVFDLAEYDPDGDLPIGNVTLTFAPTVHWVPCWAIRVTPGDTGGDLFYTADTGPSADLSAISAGATVVIAEATTPVEREDTLPFAERGHLTVADAAKLAAAAGAHTLVATHMFEEDDPEAMLEGAGAWFDGEVVLARPGVTVAW